MSPPRQLGATIQMEEAERSSTWGRSEAGESRAEENFWAELELNWESGEKRLAPSPGGDESQEGGQSRMQFQDKDQSQAKGERLVQE